MAHFSIEVVSDLPDVIYVEVDRRFDIAIHRSDAGLEIRVYPRTEGELWDAPYATFEVDESQVALLETDLLDESKGGGQ